MMNDPTGDQQLQEIFRLHHERVPEQPFVSQVMREVGMAQRRALIARRIMFAGVPLLLVVFSPWLIWLSDWISRDVAPAVGLRTEWLGTLPGMACVGIVVVAVRVVRGVRPIGRLQGDAHRSGRVPEPIHASPVVPGHTNNALVTGYLLLLRLRPPLSGAQSD